MRGAAWWSWIAMLSERRGSSGLTLSGCHQPVSVSAMRACAIRAGSSMAGSRVAERVGSPDNGVGSERRDERGREAIAAGWNIRGRPSSRADPAATISQASPGLLVFSFVLIAHGQSRVQLFPRPGQV